VKEASRLTEVEEFYWTDSSTALAWIKSQEHWGIFVGNRTAEIGKLTNIKNWRHVPGELNPADFRLYEHRLECRRELGRPWVRKEPKAVLKTDFFLFFLRL